MDADKVNQKLKDLLEKKNPKNTQNSIQAAIEQKRILHEQEKEQKKLAKKAKKEAKRLEEENSELRQYGFEFTSFKSTK